ncbi:MAG: hypothetical protein FJY82_10160, partial [Candidatus Aminicenantes bacterium]|nr:hypothetical protein [Candidatus Aminicenantes bacterium]
MRKTLVGLFLVACLGGGSAAFAQLTEQDKAEYERWEEFLKTAQVVGQEQLTGSLAVTNPWVLTLEKD